jgi:hypothetical protein
VPLVSIVSIMGPKECRVKTDCKTKDELKVFAARHKITMGEAVRRLLHGGPWKPAVAYPQGAEKKI